MDNAAKMGQSGGGEMGLNWVARVKIGSYIVFLHNWKSFFGVLLQFRVFFFGSQFELIAGRPPWCHLQPFFASQNFSVEIWGGLMRFRWGVSPPGEGWRGLDRPSHLPRGRMDSWLKPGWGKYKCVLLFFVRFFGNFFVFFFVFFDFPPTFLGFFWKKKDCEKILLVLTLISPRGQNFVNFCIFFWFMQHEKFSPVGLKFFKVLSSR